MIDFKLLNEVTTFLQQEKLVVATAESCTGGLLANLLTDISGSSMYFDRGIISYSNTAKQELLDVKAETLKSHGAVSAEVASEMALGVKNRSQVDIGISTTGIAGPTGGNTKKPVGLVYIGLVQGTEILVKEFHFKGDRREIKESTCNAALILLKQILQ